MKKSRKNTHTCYVILLVKEHEVLRYMKARHTINRLELALETQAYGILAEFFIKNPDILLGFTEKEISLTKNPIFLQKKPERILKFD